MDARQVRQPFGIRPRLSALICAVLGGGLVLTQPPYSSWPLLLPLLVGLMILGATSLSRRAAFWRGWWAGAAYFGIGLHWIAEAFLVDAEMFAWMIPIAIPLLAGGLALFWGAAFWLAHRLAAGRGGAPLVLALSWGAFEFARGHVLTGFPWALLGQGWLETPLIQSAAYGGIYGVTLLTLFSAGAIAVAVIVRRTLMRAGWAALGCALPIGMWALGAAHLDTPLSGPGLTVGVVQPAVAQQDKWKPELREQHLRDLLDATARLDAAGASIIVWPEAATPFLLAEQPKLRADIGSFVSDGTVILAGGIRVEGRGTPEMAVFNSLLAVDAQGNLPAKYDKQHLVPFGEYLPFGLERLGLRNIVNMPGGFTPGRGAGREIKIDGIPTFSAAICYEAIFPHEVAARGSDIDWIVHVTNDGWFGASAGPWQHLAQARIRAIERGVGVVRAANSGVSAIIGARGEIVQRTNLGQAATLIGPLPQKVSSTPYHRYEDWIFLLLFGTSTLFVCVTLRHVR